MSGVAKKENNTIISNNFLKIVGGLSLRVQSDYYCVIRPECRISLSALVQVTSELYILEEAGDSRAAGEAPPIA